MTGREKGLNKPFSISAERTEEQSRQLKILEIQDNVRRDAIVTMCDYRDRVLKKQDENFQADRSKRANEEIDRRLKAAIRRELRPKGVPEKNFDQRKAEIRREIDARLKPSHNDALSSLRKDLNRDIDREIKFALSLDRARSSTSSQRELTKQQFRENRQDISAKPKDRGERSR